MSNPPDAPRSLLIVEDDDRLRTRLARALRDRGFEIREAHDYDSAIASAHADSPEYLLVDLRLPGHGSGLDIIKAVRTLDETTIVVVLTGYGSIATAVEAVRLGAAEYLTKPADVDQIVAAFTRWGGDGPPLEPQAIGQVPSLARVEWEHINRVLADCGGNISQAARLLGIHRRSLQRKLERFPASR